MRKLLSFCALLLVSFSASAYTATITGGAYAVTFDFVLCGTGNCANYSTAMNPSGTFSAPVSPAPNLVGADVSGAITSYAFTDGLTNYNSSDPRSHILFFFISTDATGRIIDYSIALERYQSAVTPHVVGDRIDILILAPPGSATNHNAFCNTVGPGDVCTGITADASTSAANGGPTVLAVSPVLGGPSVPTLSEWAMILLALAMAGIGMGFHRGARNNI